MKEVFKFLTDLDNNNNRPWFTEHKEEYTGALGNVKKVTTTIEQELSNSDNLDKTKIFRIYRDVRFSKDKTPYKKSFGIHFKRATNKLRGGYYLHIEPGASMIGGGFWAPEKKDLRRIRDEIAFDDKPLRKIISNKNFINNFGSLEGDALKNGPTGFDKEHPAIDLIKMKQFLVSKRFTDEQVTSKDFVWEVVNSFNAMRPFFDYMSIVLTTNINGESILED